MKRRGSIIITAVLGMAFIGSAFVVGYSWDSLTNPPRAVAELREMPERLSLVFGPRKDTGTVLPTVQTYSDAMTQLESRHYQSVDPIKLTYSAISGMMGALNDPYTRFMPPKAWKAMEDDTRGDYVGVGATLDPSPKGAIVARPLPNSPCVRAGIRANDLIVTVDGKNVAGMDLEEIVRMIRGEEGTYVTIGIERTNNSATESLSFKLQRSRVDLPTVEYRVLSGPNKIGYVSLLQFNEKATTMLEDALTELEKKGIKGLVLDVRDNPGGLLTQAIGVSSLFMDNKSVVIQKARDGKEDVSFSIPSSYKPRNYPIAVLINGRSASASEIVSGALRDHKVATLVGESSFGKGLVQSIFPLDDGESISITTARYYTPNHVDINKHKDADGKEIKGLKPDVEVVQSKDYEFGKDETDAQLKKAVEVITSQIGKKS